MNRRKFFGAIAAAITAACVPSANVSNPWLAGRWASNADLGFYGSSPHAWWRPDRFHGVPITYDQDFAALEVRTLAALQSAWKECLAYRTGDTLIIDEQAFEVFKTLQE